MAIEASTLCHAPISRFNLDGLVKVFECERQRMTKTVVCLGKPMANKIVRQMAIVAGSDVPMAGVLPGIVIVLHNMAVYACFWVAAQIAGPLAVSKSKQPHSEEQSE